VGTVAETQGSGDLVLEFDSHEPANVLGRLDPTAASGAHEVPEESDLRRWKIFGVWIRLDLDSSRFW
jgi:hypothetical protein